VDARPVSRPLKYLPGPNSWMKAKRACSSSPPPPGRAKREREREREIRGPIKKEGITHQLPIHLTEENNLEGTAMPRQQIPWIVDQIHKPASIGSLFAKTRTSLTLCNNPKVHAQRSHRHLQSEIFNRKLATDYGVGMTISRAHRKTPKSQKLTSMRCIPLSRLNHRFWS